MSKERRRLEAVSKGAVNLLDSTAAVGGDQQTANSEQQTANSEQQTANSEQQTANSEQQTADSEQQAVEPKPSARHSAKQNAAQERCYSDETKEAEGVVSGFVPNPTVMLVRLATSGVVVPVIQVRAYLFRRGMAVRVYRAFDGWRLR